MNTRHLITLMAAMLCLTSLTAADIKVLFIGNSYTSVNDLPSVIQALATQQGHKITYSENSPGGCTFEQHCSNQSMNLIKQGGWDFVVLQEQSQLPSFPDSQVTVECLPFAARLVDSVYKYNDCAMPLFYMTWGRKNGDARNAVYFPPLGTYEGMDSLLCLRYMMMKDSNNAAVTPVGQVWHYIRNNYPEIELYSSDESHPSLAGTYAAALSFCTMFFGDDPTSYTYVPSGIDAETSDSIAVAVKRVIYNDPTPWKRATPQPIRYRQQDNKFRFFIDALPKVDYYRWDVGEDNDIYSDSIATAIDYEYKAPGTYVVHCYVKNHCEEFDVTDTVVVTVLCMLEQKENSQVICYPTHTRNVLNLQSNECISTVRLFTLAGTEVMQQTIGMPTAQINLPTLAAGTYIINVSTESGRITTHKIIIAQ